MSLDTLLTDRRLNRLVESALQRTRADIEGYLKVCGGEEPKEDEDEYFAYKGPEDGPGFAEDVAKCVMPFFQNGACPWPTLHLVDLVEALAPAFRGLDYDQESLRRIPATTEVIETLVRMLSERLVKCRVLIEIDFRDVPRLGGLPLDRACKPGEVRSFGQSPGVSQMEFSLIESSPPTFKIKGFPSVDPGSTQMSWRGVRIDVLGWVGRRVCPSFANSIRRIFLQCLPVASRRIRLCRHSHEGPDSLTRFLGFHSLELDTDGFERSELTDEAVSFKLAWGVSGLDDVRRFVYLASVALRPDAGVAESLRPEVVLRHAIWQLNERDKLGPSPLAFLASMAVFERCAAVLLSYDSRRDGPFVRFVADRVGLGPQGEDELGELVRTRNKVVHDLACRVAVNKIVLSWQLAWAGAHYLLCTLSKVEGGDEDSAATLGEYLSRVLGH